MIKYEIYKETEEATAHYKKWNWTAKDMINYYENDLNKYPTLIASFDTYAEAKKFFEEEKKNCYSNYTQGYVFELVKFDIIYIEASEYDGEIADEDYFKSSYTMDIYASEIKED